MSHKAYSDLENNLPQNSSACFQFLTNKPALWNDNEHRYKIKGTGNFSSERLADGSRLMSQLISTVFHHTLKKQQFLSLFNTPVIYFLC